MRFHARLAGSLVLLAVAACREGATEPAPAAPARSVASALVAYTPTLESAAPRAGVHDAPAVVVLDQWGKPMNGVDVTFSIVSGEGFVEETSMSSGLNGLASSNDWQLGPAPGQNVVRASLTNYPAIAPVFFTAIALALPTDTDSITTYNLVSVSGTPVPLPPDGLCPGPCVFFGGRYELAADQTYTSRTLLATADSSGVFHVDSTRQQASGPYVRSGSDVLFYTQGLLEVVGTLSGDTLSVRFGTYPDDGVLVYVRSRQPPSGRMAPLRHER